MQRSVGPAADRAVERGQAIVSAAAQLIRRSGGDALTMHNVAHEVGLSLRALYQHFAGKDDLLVALIEDSQIVFARLLEWQAEGWADPLDKLGAALTFATDARQHTDHDYNVAMTRFVAEASVSTPEQVSRAREPVVEVLARLIADAMAAGELAPGDPRDAAASVQLAYVAFQMNANLGSSIGAPLPEREQLIRFCLAGLGAELEPGWESKFRVDDAAASKLQRQAMRIVAARNQVA